MLLAAHFQATGSIRNLARLDTRSGDKCDRRKHQRKGEPEVGTHGKRRSPLPAGKRGNLPQKQAIIDYGECLTH